MGPHRQSLYIATVCLAVLAVVFLLTVAKDLRTRQQLETQLSEASRLADRRHVLTPLIAELQKNDAAPMPGGEGFPEPLPLPDTSAEDYEKVIGQILLQCDLTQTVLTPDIQSILSDKGYILVDLTARGAFSNFRNLILRIGRLPFILGIDRFRVQQPTGAGELEMFLQLRIEVVSPVGNAYETQ